MKEKKNEGITLIALVITIIVLLILAGVTLSTLFGNNGILTESKLAVEETRKSNAREQVEMAWISCETEYQAALTKDSTKTRNEYYTQENMNKHLTGQGRVLNNFVYNGEGENEIHFKSNDQGEEYTFYLQGSGKSEEIAKGTLVENVKAEHYGDYINYPVDLDDNPSTNDWRIFYNDGDNVFLIASKALPIDKIPEIETMEIYEDEYSHQVDNKVYWNEKVKDNAGASAIDETVAKKFGLNWIFTGNHRNSTNINIKCVQDLMNTNYWKSFAEGVEGAQAIGGPTLEMWINSWNQKNPNLKLIYNDGGDTNSDGSIYETDVEEKEEWWSDGQDRDLGYQFCFDASVNLPDSLKKYYDFTSGLNMNGEASSPAGLSGSGGFYNEIKCWLASPSAFEYGVSDDDVCYSWVTNNYPSLGGSYYGWEYNLQPVVCLPASVNATKSGTAWTIEP